MLCKKNHEFVQLAFQGAALCLELSKNGSKRSTQNLRQNTGTVLVERPAGKSAEVAAKIVGVTRSSVEQALAILRKGVPELLAAAKSGKVSLDAAATIAKLSSEEQVTACKENKVTEVVKELRAKASNVVLPDIPRSIRGNSVNSNKQTEGEMNMDARLNITYSGGNGDLPDMVNYDASDAEVRTWATEAVRAGSVPGIGVQAGADFTDFVVDRFPATDDVPQNRLLIRPKTPFGTLSIL